MFEIIKTLWFVLTQSPLGWIFAVVFTFVGLWYGNLKWSVPRRRMQTLTSEQERLRKSIVTMQERVAEQERSYDEELLLSNSASLPDEDDLTQLEGIDAPAAARLHEAGVFTFEQLSEIDEMSEDEREKFRLTFGLPKIRWESWRWAWDFEEDRPEQPLAELDEETVYELYFESDENTALDDELGIIYLSEPSTSDELTIIRGVNRKIEADLNKLGVYRYHQIASWGVFTVEEFHERLGFKGKIDRDGWKAQACELAVLTEQMESKSFVAPRVVDHVEAIDHMFSGESGVRSAPERGIVYDFEPEVTDDLSQLSGVNATIVRRLNDEGIFRFKQIGTWTDGNVREYSQRLRLMKEEVEENHWVPQAAMLDRKLYMGSCQWGSLRPSVKEYDDLILTSFRGDDVRAEEDRGIVFREVPSDPDDLTTIAKISEEMQEILQENGVYRISQIAYWSEANVAAFAEKLGCLPDEIYREDWIRQAEALSFRDEREVPTDAEEEDDLVIAEEESHSFDQPEDEQDDLVISEEESHSFDQPVDEEDDLVISEEESHSFDEPEDEEDELVIAEEESHSFDQSADDEDDLGLLALSSEDAGSDFESSDLEEPDRGSSREEIAEEADEPELEETFAESTSSSLPEEAGGVLTQAKGSPALAAEGKAQSCSAPETVAFKDPVEVDKKFGYVFSEAPGEVDDLKKIKGIGPKIEQKLHGYGVYQFKQIALWSSENEKAFASNLKGFKNRISRDKWREQARELYQKASDEPLPS